MTFLATIRIAACKIVTTDFKRCYRITTNKGQAVLVAVVIGTFEQYAAGEDISEFQVNVHGRQRICQQSLRLCLQLIFHVDTVISSLQKQEGLL
jgi:hypothetical protein